MTDIVFINPPNLMEPALDAGFPHLGVLYMMALLSQEGFSVQSENMYQSSSWEDVENQIRLIKSNFIAIPCYTEQRKSVLRLAELCKQAHPSSTIVLGGPHATFLDMKILENFPCIDYIIRGEGEYRLLKFLKSQKDRTNIENINGLSFRKDSIPQRTGVPSPILDLDSLPYPMFPPDYFAEYTDTPRLEVHFRSDKSFSNQKIAPIMTSRGCTSTCNFCSSSSFWGHTYRVRSPQCIIAEIKKLTELYDIHYLDFLDDNFTHDVERVKTLCRLMILEGLDLSWWCSGRVTSSDEEMFDLMRQAGCFLISFGVESGSPIVLKKVGKHITPREIIEATSAARKSGLAYRTSVTVGNIGESDVSIDETINLLNQIQPDQIGLFLTEIFPGTPLYSIAQKRGLLNDDYWFKDDSLPYVFNEIEHPLSRLLIYRDRIVNSLNKKIVYLHEDNNFDMNLILE